MSSGIRSFLFLAASGCISSGGSVLNGDPQPVQLKIFSVFKQPPPTYYFEFVIN